MQANIRFVLLDGLRAWVSWCVVLAHVIFLARLDDDYKIARVFRNLGDNAVMVFVILSGFVIAHLILIKQETYLRYLTRRFFRIFPVYIVCVVAGAITALLLDKFSGSGKAGPAFMYGDYHGLVDIPAHSIRAHILANLMMLQGAIPNELLSGSGQAFLHPAWSLSLEWQLYLLAPAILFFAARKNGGMIGLFIAVLIATGVYRSGALGTFEHPSFILASGIYFLVGIGTRLLLPHFWGAVTEPLAIVLALAIVVVSGELKGFIPFAVWGVVVAILCTNEQWKSEPSAHFRGIANVMFKSRIAVWLGKRSYSVYLSHGIVLVVVQYLVLSLFPDLSRLGHAAALAAASIPLIVATTYFLYRFVELPGIAFGHLAARKFGAQVRTSSYRPAFPG
jgi:peptidoglycan/LPS O-acetylase OafA/YrhL